MMKIFPAIDLIDGRPVRLSQGDYGRATAYGDDPLEVACRFADAGIGQLHLVDLDGAKAAAPRNLAVLERIAARLPRVRVEWGGGIKSADALRAAFDAGAAQVVCGSVAVTAPEEFSAWLDRYGDRIVLGADVKDGRVATHGWLRSAECTAGELIGRFPALRRVVCTDIARDGMLCSPSVNFYTALQERFPDVEITVSGGVGSADDLRRLEAAGLRSAIVGKAYYEGRVTLEELAALNGTGPAAGNKAEG